MRKINLSIKRIMDIFGSFLGMLVLSPVFIIISIAIKIDSRGTIFFKQKRLGKNGKEFMIIKFRTMIINAENLGDGIKVKNFLDSRITRMGRLLRSTSFDELPQLLNVLIGNMSLVGPRPPVPYHPYKYADYPSVAKQRFCFKPGITGLSQITVRNSVSWDDRILVDIEYLNNFSIILDIKIIFVTFFKIFSKEDIYLN